MAYQQSIDIGTATISPNTPQVAGEFVSLEFTYTAGHPIDDTGFLKIAFRFASDFGTPQFEEPQEDNFCTVHTDADCRLDVRFDPKANTRPWGKSLLLKVMKGYVSRGDQIRVIFGDRSGGSRGWQLPTFCENTFEFKTMVDPVATFQFKELPESPTLHIMPGEPAQLTAIAPSAIQVGKPFGVYLKIDDRWGNPVGLPVEQPQQAFKEPGIFRLDVTDSATGLTATTNPIKAIDGELGPIPRWADLHGQSEETIGTNTIEQYFTFARDYAKVDLAAHQGNDFQITDDFWQVINETTKRFNAPGAFVTFPGYEWSGNTPLGGDRNVWYEKEGGPIYRSCFDLLPKQAAKHEQAGTADQLFTKLSKVRRHRPFCYAHVGGRYANLEMHDEAMELAVEVHSAWGTFEWLIDDALRSGYRVGIVANSDGHKGRPGASYPGASRFGSMGGLTAYLCQELTRPSAMEAIRSRHCYATTGHRPLLDVTLTDAENQQLSMGDIAAAKNPCRLQVRASGTAGIQGMIVRNGLTQIAEWVPPLPPKSQRIKVIWQGAEVRGRDRQVVWDGQLEIAGATIRSMMPINFWNPDRQPVLGDDRTISWQSITTGGVTGLILELDTPPSGEFRLACRQGEAACDLETLNEDGRIWEFGGLGKRLSVSRIPDVLPLDIDLTVEIADLVPGDNPIYVRVDQEDGHMAWSSPIYLTTDGK